MNDGNVAIEQVFYNEQAKHIVDNLIIPVDSSILPITSYFTRVCNYFGYNITKLMPFSIIVKTKTNMYWCDSTINGKLYVKAASIFE
jgi:hypothetical protein